MSINLGTYALVSALAVGGAVAQYQSTQPGGPQDPNATQQQQSVQPGQDATGYSSSPSGTTTTVPVDCNTLMTSHQQMMQDLDRMDNELDTRVTQMRDAQNDKTKLDATSGVVELLVTQRKQIRDRMMTMEHQTLQFLVSNKGQDLATSCPQLTQQLQQGSMHGHPTPETTEQGGPNDLEFGNDGNTGNNGTTDNNTTTPKQNR